MANSRVLIQQACVDFIFDRRGFRWPTVDFIFDQVGHIWLGRDIGLVGVEEEPIHGESIRPGEFGYYEGTLLREM